MKTYAFLLRYALLALPLACASLMSSCSDDDDGGTYDNGPVTVRLNVSAAQIGDLNGTRAEGDIVPADEHEFINTLKVYIVNDANQIVQDLSPDLSSNILAQTGDLEEWHSDPITIAPGTYTVYAFANIEKYNGETDDTQNLTGEAMLGQCFPKDGTLNAKVLKAYRITDPASYIDLDNGMYIPMSGVSEKLTVTSDMNNGSGAGFTVHLDRLVSKVKMTISDFPETVNENTTFTFFGYSQNVPLMEGSTSSDHGDRTGEFTAKLSDVEDTEGVRQFSFYANETPDGIPFTVTLATDNTTGVTTYTASPRRRELPRNTVYPLTLIFPDYAPVIEWRSWVAPIGNYPVEVNVKEENYTVYIAQGAQFEFTVGMESSTNTAKVDSVQWTVPDDLAGKIAVESNSGATLSAALSAGVGVGTDLPLSVTVSWFATIEETNPNLLTRTYNVIIHTIDITDVEFKTGTRAGGSYGMRLLGGEVLNMFKTK